ncbi:4'-phosphopantetheinyl transferase superfamily protein [Streptomyces sp. LX-29]|uniref:4'-phosphopantetheinyl transferase superfamily protein n=1 Tax=Streptomyces sp. LX-29 TaxID=2900152 RepID=UPI00240D4D4C|nr:4'-phosphopantetheinyl transferase superfamily protein [Streptomyces sp. LX-29]WFB09336.1 4'-phosphopantetheinyl transferase superfamily protein [Streptomyces sp. LX-29]
MGESMVREEEGRLHGRYRLVGAEVEVWTAPVPRRLTDAALACLSAPEHARALSFGEPLRRHEFVAGRALARRVLAARLGVRPAEVALAEDPAGRPYLATDRRLATLRRTEARVGDFNLSHSDGLVLLALTGSAHARVGVDVERLHPRPCADRLAARYFSTEERRRLARCAGHEERGLGEWYRIWTRREALAKARGAGARGMRWPPPAPGRHGARMLTPAVGYAACLAVLRTPPSASLRQEPRMNTVEDLCTLIESCIAWEADETPQPITPDTALLATGMLDSMAIMKIVAAVEAATGVPFPETRIVAASFTSPRALWEAVEDVLADVEADAAASGDARGALQ